MAVVVNTQNLARISEVLRKEGNRIETKPKLNVLKYNLKFMRLQGMKKDKTSYIRIFVVLLANFILASGSIWFVLQSKYNLSDKIEPILASCYMIGSLLKFFAIIQKKQKMFEFVECVESIWTERENAQYKDILLRSDRKSNMLVICYFAIFAVMIFVMTSIPMVYYVFQKYIFGNSDAEITVMVRVDFEYTTSKFVDYLLSGATSWVAVSLVFSVDTLFPAFAIHTAGVYQLLDKRLQSIVNSMINSGYHDEIRLREEIFKSDKSFVKLQAAAIKLSTILEDLFNLPVLIKITFSSIKICVTLWRFSLIGSTSDSSDPPSMWIIFLGCLSVELIVNFAYCYYGQNISNEADKITETLYVMKWYEIKDNKLRKMIQLLLQRSQSPIMVTAGKFYVVKLTTYLQILKGAYAYFTFMRRMD